jgi:hypothetical protein
LKALKEQDEGEWMYVIENTSQDPYHFLNEAAIFLQHRKFESAIPALERHLENNGLDNTARNMLASAKLRLLTTWTYGWQSSDLGNAESQQSSVLLYDKSSFSSIMEPPPVERVFIKKTCSYSN